LPYPGQQLLLDIRLLASDQSGTLPGMLQVARSAADAAWATIGLAVLAIGTVIIAGLAYKSANRQLRTLKTQVAEQHSVNIRQIEVLDAQLAELREAPKLREREVEERSQAEERQAQIEERQAAERRRAQAEKVFLVEDRTTTTLS
jgi:hypothetical protein